jgi:light-regulated signal transduction histidine kinase (bacteriophytochrome)
MARSGFGAGFAPFQRLHLASEFEGTASVSRRRRAIARQGGHTWADAAIDVGATFYFTLGDTK